MAGKIHKGNWSVAEDEAFPFVEEDEDADEDAVVAAAVTILTAPTAARSMTKKLTTRKQILSS